MCEWEKRTPLTLICCSHFVAENLFHFPSKKICHQKYFLTTKATINSSLKHRRPFFQKRCVLKVSLTIFISHYSREIPYFQVQWRTFSIFMYSIEINVLYFFEVASSIYIIIANFILLPFYNIVDCFSFSLYSSSSKSFSSLSSPLPLPS